MFGESEYDVNRRYSYTPFEEQLQALERAKSAGKIRHWGLSNETPWGITKMASLATQLGAPRPLLIQNAFSLLCRTVYGGVVECCLEDKIALLAYSPLAMGLLTGKYGCVLYHTAINPGPETNLFVRCVRYTVC